MRYLLFFLILGFISCGYESSPYVKIKNSSAWMAFRVKPDKKAYLEQKEKNRPRTLPTDDQELVKLALENGLISLEDWLEAEKTQLRERWEELYGLKWNNGSLQWVDYQGQWLLLIRLSDYLRRGRMPYSAEHPRSLEPFSGELFYYPEQPQIIRGQTKYFYKPMRLHFERGYSVGAQHFFHETDVLAHTAHFSFRKSDSIESVRGSKLKLPPTYIARSGVWKFYDKSGQYLRSIKFKDDSLIKITWANGQTGRQYLTHLSVLQQSAQTAALLLFLLSIALYIFRQKLPWGKNRDRSIMGLLTWLLVIVLLITLFKQLLPDWQLFFHPQAPYRGIGLFVFLQVVFFAGLVGVRKPQWYIPLLGGLLFFINLAYLLDAAQLGLSTILPF